MTEHLKPNRSLILSRALLAGAAGLIPVPYVDDLLAGAVRSALIRRIAEIRGVDVDANAIEELAHPTGSRVLSAAGMGAIAVGGTRRVVRKIATALLFVRRVDEAIQTFYLGTLFDHYCARQHVGAGLDGKKAQAVRAVIEVAAKKARSESFERAFKKGLRMLAHAATSWPRSAMLIFARKKGGTTYSASGAPYLRRGPSTPERVETVEDRIDHAAESSFVQKAVATVEKEAGPAQRSYVGSLVAAFDAAWAAVQAAG